MKHPNNGASFSKRPAAKSRVNTAMHRSHDRDQAAFDQAARDASKEREFHKRLLNGDLVREIIANKQPPRDL